MNPGLSSPKSGFFYPLYYFNINAKKLKLFKIYKKNRNNISKEDKYQYSISTKNEITQCQTCGTVIGAAKVWENI